MTFLKTLFLFLSIRFAPSLVWKDIIISWYKNHNLFLRCNIEVIKAQTARLKHEKYLAEYQRLK